MSFAVLAVFKNLGQSENITYMRRNFGRFLQHVKATGAIPFTAEIDVGQGFYFPPGLGHIQLYTRSPELFNNKDRAFNLLIQDLPSDIKYVAWMDGDVQFADPNWVDTASRLLDKVPVIQMFSHTLDLDANFMPVPEGVYTSWAYRYTNSQPHCWKDGQFAGMGWGFRRDILNKLYRLVDWVISGQFDSDQALAFIGRNRGLAGYSAVYQRKCQDWIDKAYGIVKGEITYFPGLLLHHWHGPRVNRQYDRVKSLLVKYQFDPDKDLEVNDCGLYEWSGNNPPLEAAMKEWYRIREGLSA